MHSLLMLTALLLLSSPANAQDPLTLGLVFDQVEESANRVLDRTSSMINGAITNAAVNTINAVALARIEYKHALDYTLDRLDDGVREHMETLQGDVADVERALIEEHDRIDETIAKLSIHMRDVVPFSNKEPRVLEFGSPIVVRGSSDTVPITFSGVLLNHPKNEIEVNGHTYPPVAHSETALTFEVPAATVYGAAPPDQSTLERVVLTARYGWPWAWRKKTYAYQIRTVPRRVATLDVIYEVETDTSEIRERASQWWSTSIKSRCPVPGEGRTELHHSFNAATDAGFSIVAARAEQDLMSGGCNSSCLAQVENWGPAVASIKCDVRTDTKSCVNCNYRCRLVVTEKRDFKTTRTDTVHTAVTHGAPLALDLDQHATGVKRIEATMFNGERLIMDERVREAPFLRADYSARNHQVIIRPLLGID